jgi:hypothetical protein
MSAEPLVNDAERTLLVVAFDATERVAMERISSEHEALHISSPSRRAAVRYVLAGKAPNPGTACHL